MKFAYKDGIAKLLYSYANSYQQNNLRFDNEIITEHFGGWQLLLDLSPTEALAFNDADENEDTAELTEDEINRLDAAIGAIIHRNQDDVVSCVLYRDEAELDAAWEKMESKEFDDLDDPIQDDDDIETDQDPEILVDDDFDELDYDSEDSSFND